MTQPGSNAPQHEESCLRGFGIYLAPKQDDKYTLVPYHNCKWDCDAQAYYRIGRVAQQAIARHDHLTWDWLSDAARVTLRQRALRQGLGFMSITVVGRNDKCVIAAPQLMKPAAMDAAQLFHEATPQLVQIGITRLDKAKMWAPDSKGFEPIASTRRTNKREVEELMAGAGFINGRITINRPIEYHIDALNCRLADTINLGA